MTQEHFIVVGGTAGNGRALVRQLCQRGQTVSLIGRRRSPEVESQLPGLKFFPTDLADSAALAKSLESIVATAGKINHIVFFQRYRGSGDAWAGELQVSLTSTKLIVEFCAAHFVVGGNCAVVVVGSNASRVVFSEQPVSYHAAKAALAQMARYYAVTLGSLGVRVNTVTPDAVIKDEARAFYDQNPQLRKLYESVTPLGRMGTPQDVVNAIEFLLGPQAQFITGQELVVDGGLSLAGNAAVARKIAQIDGLKLTR